MSTGEQEDPEYMNPLSLIKDNKTLIFNDNLKISWKKTIHNPA